VVLLVLGFGVDFVGSALFPHLWPGWLILASLSLRAVAAIAIVVSLGWMHKCGFTRLSEWRSRYLLWWVVGFGVVALITALDRATVHSVFGLSFTAALTLLVAINEEGFCRGALLQAFLPTGVRRAILVQGALFGAFHSFNVLSGMNLSYVAFQVVIAGCLGIFLGALRLRTNAIWPCLAIHGIVDFASLVHTGYGIGTNRVPFHPSAMLTGVAIYATLAAIGVFLLARPGKVSRLWDALDGNTPTTSGDAAGYSLAAVATGASASSARNLSSCVIA
jgi:hypothetical protein